MAGIENQGLQPRVEVPEGSWRHLENQGVLFTHGIRTAIGVSIYCSTDKLGMLGHFDAQSFERNDFQDMCDSAYRWVTDAASTSVWMGGGLIIMPQHAEQKGYDHRDIDLRNTTTLINRETASAYLDSWVGHVASMNIKWLNDLTEIVTWLDTEIPTIDYSLNVTTGEEKIEISRTKNE
jgi:hypothetical protein